MKTTVVSHQGGTVRLQIDIDITQAVLVAIALFLAPAGASAQTGWSEANWDPADAAAELTLPLPCGGGLALRRVDTPTEANWLADIPVRLGAMRSALPHTDFIWSDRVAGSLSDDDAPDSRHFYIGVYEVTTRQYLAVTADCRAALAIPPGLPVENATWFEAVTFVEQLNSWLLSEAPTALGDLGTDGGFVRLPTEAEWEFAARGGAAVPDVETRRAPMFPMDAPLQRYAHHLGPESCNDRVRPIGDVRPNPLGLYDIVGNVSELVHDPYRLNANGRLHGQAGGVVARGGSCLTPREQISTATRVELPIVDSFSGGLYRGEFTGFRIAVVGVALPESVPTQAIIDDFNDLSAFATEQRTARTVEAILARLGEDEETRRLVEDLTADYRTEIARRERMMRRSIRSSIVSAAFMARSYFQDSELYARHQRICTLSSVLTETDNDLHNRNCEQAQQLKMRRALTRSLYGDLMARMVDDLSVEEIAAQLPAARDALGPSRMADDFARLFVCQLSTYANGPLANLDAFFLAIERRDLSGCSG